MSKTGLSFLLILCLATNAWAADAPQKLGLIQQKLQAEQEQKAALQRQVSAMQDDINKTRDKLIDVGASIQDNEKTLKNLETRISMLESEKAVLDDSLLKDQQSIARLILALERLRRTPPEALLAKPGAPLQAAQSALLMQEIIPALYRQAETVRTNIAELEQVSKDLQIKRSKAIVTSEDLKIENRELSALVEKREQLFTATSEDLKEHQDSIRRISMEASNLQDLVYRLDKDRQDRQEQQKSNKTASLNLPRAGQPRLPVSGIIRIRYGQPDNFGAPSRGLTIEGGDGALVVAPMGGIVRFTGPFKNYGQIIILEHQNGYHSLIAGLKKIDTVVGQSITAGEPLGSLDSASNGEKPTLYYELRLNGQPVNPAGKFADLG